MGEGAGVLVFEALEHALARGAPILAEYLGGAMTTDAYHMPGPCPRDVLHSVADRAFRKPIAPAWGGGVQSSRVPASSSLAGIAHQALIKKDHAPDSKKSERGDLFPFRLSCIGFLLSGTGEASNRCLWPRHLVHIPFR